MAFFTQRKASSGSGSSTFIGLTDVPASYTGHALQSLRVNAAETAIEFFTASGTGLTILTATGTVDDSNTAFTFISKPVVIVVNGISLKENAGWTWSVLTATLTNPVGTGGIIYGEI